MDISRSSHDARKHFDATRALQGRLLTDDDLNVADIIAKEDRRLERVDVIGPAGSPDDGFKIDGPTTDGQGHVDLAIKPGSFYVGGLRLVMEDDGTGKGEHFSAQRDWLQQSATDRKSLNTANGFDLVYIEAWQQPVTAVEDGELREEALGGPDTCARLRTMRRVRLLSNVNTGDCAPAMQLLAKTILSGALGPDFGLKTDAHLHVGFTAGQQKEDLCSPAATAGFLGAENQAIRLELVDGTHLLWGYDNGAPLYRVTVAVDQLKNQTTVTMLTALADADHWPLKGQTVEILAWSTRLANGEKIAEIRGPVPPGDGTPVSFITTVDTSYDPSTKTLVLKSALPASFNAAWQGRYSPPADQDAIDPTAHDTFLFMRVWNQGAAAQPLPLAFTPGQPATLEGTGLQVTITGTTLRSGDYWVIAARPRTPAQVVPWQLTAASGRPTDGTRRFYAPLAILTWSAGTAKVHDCRPSFPPLTAPPPQLGGCSLHVGPGQGWEKALQGFAAKQDVNVCFEVGNYPLDATLVFSGLGHVKLTGGGPGTRIVCANREVAFKFQGCKSVLVRDLAAAAGAAAFGKKTENQQLNGALTFDNCGSVTVEHVSLTCAPAKRRAATCLTARRAPGGSIEDGTVRVRGCDLSIGHEQVGILVANARRVDIRENRLSAAPAWWIGRPPTLKAITRDMRLSLKLQHALVSKIAVAVTPSGVWVGGNLVTFQTDPKLSYETWTNLVKTQPPAANITLVAAKQYLHKLARHILLGKVAASETAFTQWRQKVEAEISPAASQGIVVSGQSADEVIIADNSVSAAVQGIHVALSHRDQPGRGPPDFVGRAQIRGNTVAIYLGPTAFYERHGIFVGACQSLVVEDNAVSVTRTTLTQKLLIEGVRVFGQFGPLVLIRKNVLQNVTTGVRLHAKGGLPQHVLWKISHNCAPNATPVVAEDGHVPTPAVLPGVDDATNRG